MRSILMSIKPKWVEKIASGEKTVEVRKTVPKCGTPFKVYIYETLDGGHSCKRCKETSETCYSWAKSGVGCYNGSGKVVGEFVCDEVFEIENSWFDEGFNRAAKQGCIYLEDLALYLGGNDGYALHISDLKIYDKPKALSEFGYPCDGDCDRCKYERIKEDRIDCYRIVECAPKPWCYVEEL